MVLFFYWCYYPHVLGDSVSPVRNKKNIYDLIITSAGKVDKGFSRPGRSQGCSTNTFVIDWLVDWFNNWPFSLPQLYGAATPKRLQICLPVRLCHSDQELSTSWRASKSHQWFKSYGHFTEGVDFCLLVELQQWRVCAEAFVGLF